MASKKSQGQILQDYTIKPVWGKILIVIAVQISDSSGDKVADAFCLGQRGEDAEL